MDNFTIKVKEFDPIKTGKIEVKPLTILIGKNNTGKSYFAMLIYSILQSLFVDEYQGHYRSEYNILRTRMLKRTRFREDIISKKTRLDIINWYNDNYKSFNKNKNTSLPENLKNDLLNSVFNSFSDSIKTSIEEELKSIFSPNLNDLFCDTSTSFEVDYITKLGTIKLKYLSEEMSIKIKLDENYKKFKINFLTSSHIEFSKGKNEITFSLPSNISKDKRMMERILFDEIVEMTMNHFSDNFLVEPSYYLPAARSGILSAHKLLAYTVIKRSRYSGLEDFKIGKLPGVIVDFLANISTMDEIKRRTPKKYLDIVKFNEEKLLKGIVDLKDNTEYPEIIYKYKNKEFPLHLTSSMVSELSPFVLYFKHILPEKCVLIIEEPESHLHPAAQRLIAKLIVRIVNSGIKVILTTHSDLILQQIQTSALLYNNKEKQVELGYSAEDTLSLNKISTNLFYNDNKINCSKIKQIDMNDTSMNDTNFNEIYHELYDEMIKAKN